jgi:hypothetical protein
MSLEVAVDRARRYWTHLSGFWIREVLDIDLKVGHTVVRRTGQLLIFGLSGRGFLFVPHAVPLVDDLLAHIVRRIWEPTEAG